MNRFKQNRDRFAEQLKNGELAVFYAGVAPNSTQDSYYPYRPDKNFFYLTGLTRFEFILVMAKNDDETKTTLFIKAEDKALEKWIGKSLTKEHCIEVSGVEDIKFIKNFDNYLNSTLNIGKFDTLYLDLFRLTPQVTETPAMTLAKLIQDRYPFVHIKNASPIMADLRKVKSAEEVEDIKNALMLTNLGIEAIMKTLKPGDYEYQPAAEFEYTIKQNGADREAFETIAASGENAVILHHIENSKKMKSGEMVLFDLGAQYKEYAGDISRTLPVNGKFTDRQKELYTIVLNAQKNVIEAIKPGMKHAELNKIASESLGKGLIEAGVMESMDDIREYYYHGVSHHMGLDVHDHVERGIDLEVGMVLTVEPGIYIEEEDIGIRIEDNVLVTENGCEVLSDMIIKEIDEIEAFMSGEKAE